MAGAESLSDRDAVPATRPGPHTVTLALALLLGLQPVTTDLYLPALPALRTAIGASLGQAQLTLSGRLLAYAPGEGMAAMSRGLTGLGLIAVASPLVGGLLAAQLGWRATLAALGLFAAVALAFVALRLPETLAVRRLDALRPASVLALWWRIARDPQFRAYATLTAATYGGLFAFLAGGSFVMIDAFGLSRGECGLLYATHGLAYVAGTFMAPRWLAMHGARGSLARAAWLTLIGGVSMAVLVLTGMDGVWGWVQRHGEPPLA